MIAAASAAALTLSAAAFAQQGQFGTPEEARAMLDKAVAAVRATKRLVMSVFSGLGREDNDCTCFLIPSLWRGAVLMVNRYADAAQAKADRCAPDERVSALCAEA